MVHMPSADQEQGALSSEHQALLLQLARQSILYTLEHGGEMPIAADDYPAPLQEQSATFVTLRLNGELRGCIGTLEAHRPLVEDIAHNAYAAAFGDPRFMPVTMQEYQLLDYHISILNPAEEMSFDSEADLIRQLRPGIDGLIMQDGVYRGTFLPSVWEQLPTAEEFISHLKLKAGLSVDHWSPTLKVWRYTTFSFS